MFKNDYADGKKSLTRAVLRFSIRTGGRVIHGNEVIPEGRVDPPVVVELEDDGPAELGDLPDEFVLEDPGPYGFAYESNWISMAVSQSSPNPFQTSSLSVAFSVRTKRHWFLYTLEFPDSSVDLISSVSSGSGPTLASTMAEYSHSYVRVEPLSLVGLNFKRKSCAVEFENVAIPHDEVLSQPITSLTSPFFASLPRILLMYLYQLSAFAEKYCRNCETFARSSVWAP